jgi:fucose 4-O-acetylase-like acetyltransferase
MTINVEGTAPSAFASAQAASARPYFHDINLAKGLGIFLVVLGHLVTGQPPADNQWYLSLRAAIYAFHMPFFVYLSGFIFYQSRTHLTGWAGMPPLIRKRGERLLLPFFAFGLLIILGKHVADGILHVDNVSASVWTDLANMFWNTRESAAKSIWYVFVLFVWTILLIVLHHFIRSAAVLFAIALPLSLLPVPPILYLDRVVLYLPFFLAGGIAAGRWERWFGYLDRHLWLNVILFAAAIVITRIAQNFQLSLILCGFLSIPALHGLCRRPAAETGGILAALGRYSFVIYLLNTIAIGVAKGVMLPFLSWNGPGFLGYFVVLLAAGIFGPILAKRLIFKRSPYLDRLTN